LATNIPPHHLGELCDALIDLSKHKDLEVKDLLKHIKGPDFPTGGQILNSKSELARSMRPARDRARPRRVEAGRPAPGWEADHRHLGPLRGEQVQSGE